MSKQTILNYESTATTALNGASTKGSPFNGPEWREFSANADKKHAAAVEAAKPVMEKLRRKHHARSTELAPVVGVYEDAPAAIPPIPKPEDYGWRPERKGAHGCHGSFKTKAQEQAYYAAFDRHVAAVIGQTPPPVIVPRNNIPNRYDREALEAVGEWVRLPPPITAESLLHFFDVLKVVGATDRGAFFGTFIEVGRVSKKNDYGVSALEDFIEDPYRLNRAQEHFLRLTQNGMTEKTAFRLMLMTYCDE